MAADVVFQETNAVLNSFWGGQEENAVTPRRGHYQLYGPQTRILLKDFLFLLTVSECAPEDSNGLERRMRRISLCS